MDNHDLIINAITKMKELQPNWDTYYGFPIKPEIIDAAVQFVKKMPGCVGKPAVVPLSSGTLQLEWNSGDIGLELEFETPESIHFLRWHERENMEEEASFSIEDSQYAQELIDWYLQSIENARADSSRA